MATGGREQPPDVSPSWSLARMLLSKPKVFQAEDQSGPLETGNLRSARADLVGWWGTGALFLQCKGPAREGCSQTSLQATGACVARL